MGRARAEDPCGGDGIDMAALTLVQALSYPIVVQPVALQRHALGTTGRPLKLAIMTKPSAKPASTQVSRIIKAPRKADLQGFLRAVLAAAPPPRGGVRVAIDVDPQSFM